MSWTFCVAFVCLLLVCVTHSNPIDPDGTGGSLESNQIKQDAGDDNQVLVGSHSHPESALPIDDNGMPIIKPTELTLGGIIGREKTSISKEALEASGDPDSRLVKSQNFGQLPQAGNQDKVGEIISNVNQKLIPSGEAQPQYYPPAERFNLETEKQSTSNEQFQQQGSQSQPGQIGQLDQRTSLGQQSQQQPQHQLAAETRLGEIQQPQYQPIQPSQVGEPQLSQYGSGQQNQFGLSQQQQYKNQFGPSQQQQYKNQFDLSPKQHFTLGQQNQVGHAAESQYNSVQQNQYGQGGVQLQGNDLLQQQQNVQGEKSQYNSAQQNQYGEVRQSLSGQGQQNQFGLDDKSQLDLKQQSPPSQIQPNQQVRSDEYPDTREEVLSHADSEQTRLTGDREADQYYQQTQEPVLSEDADVVSSERQAIEAPAGDRVQPARPTMLPEIYPTGRGKSEWDELYEEDEEEDAEEKEEEEEDEEEDQVELEAEERALLNQDKDTQASSSLYGQSPNEGKLHGNSQIFSHPTDSTGGAPADMQSEEQEAEQEEEGKEKEEDDWYDDPNSYGEGDKSYAYGDQKEEEDVAEGDDNVKVSDNDEYYKNQQEYQGEGDDGFEEDVVDSAMVKKDKQPTAPSSMVLFYTWTIVAILIMVVSVSTYQTRCKGLRSHIPKLTHSDDRKRLLEHEYT